MVHRPEPAEGAGAPARGPGSSSTPNWECRPSIAADAPQAVQVAAAVAPPSLGVPEPVPDFQATTSTIATQDQLAQLLTPTSLSNLDNGGGDSLVVDIPTGEGG